VGIGIEAGHWRKCGRGGPSSSRSRFEGRIKCSATTVLPTDTLDESSPVTCSPILWGDSLRPGWRMELAGKARAIGAHVIGAPVVGVGGRAPMCSTDWCHIPGGSMAGFTNTMWWPISIP
jgi:hypothetical protein